MAKDGAAAANTGAEGTPGALGAPPKDPSVTQAAWRDVPRTVARALGLVTGTSPAAMAMLGALTLVAGAL
ncbi:MAG: hypothetical protein ACK4YP_15930, partial [Myxococcota bacterium]